MSVHGKDLVSTEHYLVYFAKINLTLHIISCNNPQQWGAKEMHRSCYLKWSNAGDLTAPPPIRIPSLLQQEDRKKAPQYPLSLRPLPLLEFRLSWCLHDKVKGCPDTCVLRNWTNRHPLPSNLNTEGPHRIKSWQKTNFHSSWARDIEPPTLTLDLKRTPHFPRAFH